MVGGSPLGEPAVLPSCPTCGGKLTFISGGRIGGAHHYAEGFIYRCPAHGLVWHTREGIHGRGPDNPGGELNGVRAPVKPTPRPRSVAASVDEPEYR
jgi:hypothetical protein